jgi:hypothetical protein
VSDGWLGDEPDEVDETSPRRPPRVLVASIAVLVALALVGGLIAVVRGGDDDATAGSSSSTSTTGAGSPTTGSAPATGGGIDAEVARISDFVARARDLPFDHPVKVTLLDDAAFKARVRADAIDDEQDLTETEGVLRALGLLDPGVSLQEVLTSFLEQGVVGFYDPKTDELVVRGAEITPYVRTTLAHELTHALDDQHFQLDRPELDRADDERGFAFSSLVEGNAVRIQDEYKATLSKADRHAADDEEARLGGGVDLSSIPRVIPELIGFPYIFGPRLADALAKAGGERRVDAAFTAPPETSEQVVDAAAWLAGKATPVKVPPPKADGTVYDQGALGFWGVYMLLEEDLGEKDAATAAQGWGGDWYVAWKRGDDTCVRASFVMDTGRDLQELTGSLEEWAGDQHDAKVTQADGSVGFTACG